MHRHRFLVFVVLATMCVTFAPPISARAQAPTGPVTINAVTDIHISRIDKVGGQIMPVVIETIRGVDQFLGLDPAEYLKKPRLINLKGTFAK